MIIAIVLKDLGGAILLSSSVLVISMNSSRVGAFTVFISSLLGFGSVLVSRLQIKQEIYQLAVSYSSYQHSIGLEAFFCVRSANFCFDGKMTGQGVIQKRSRIHGRVKQEEVIAKADEVREAKDAWQTGQPNTKRTIREPG